MQVLTKPRISGQVTGAILIDTSSGLCLGAIGDAREEDAAQLLIAARTACDDEGIGAVRVRGQKVLLKMGQEVAGAVGKILLGVWKN